MGGEAAARRGSLYELLASERLAILDYARRHPALHHRELAWEIVDEGICIVHRRLLRRMDGLSVSIEAAAALATLDGDARPDIQSDHGSGFIARDFVETLSASGVTHTRIRPHTPTDNAEIERYHRTIGEQIEEYELQDFARGQAVIAGIIEAYNTIRLHSALSFLRPVDYDRGDPETLLAERRRRLHAARDLRKQENIKLRQRLIPWPDDKTTPYPESQIVSL